jgi:hypothetical protein
MRQTSASLSNNTTTETFQFLPQQAMDIGATVEGMNNMSVNGASGDPMDLCTEDVYPRHQHHQQAHPVPPWL